MAGDIDNLLFFLETKAAYCGRQATRHGKNTTAGHQAEYAADEYARWATLVRELVAFELANTELVIESETVEEAIRRLDHGDSNNA